MEIFKSSMLEAESAIALQGKYVPGVGATGGGGGGGRPTPYDRSRGRGMRGTRGAARGRGGNIKGVMGTCAYWFLLEYSVAVLQQ